MELMPFQEVSLASYTTLSPAGLSHYVNGVPVSFVPLQRWLNERESYRALQKLRFFQADTTVTPQLVIQLVIQLLWLFLKVEDFDGFTMDLPWFTHHDLPWPYENWENAKGPFSEWRFLWPFHAAASTEKRCV